MEPSHRLLMCVFPKSIQIAGCLATKKGKRIAFSSSHERNHYSMFKHEKKAIHPCQGIIGQCESVESLIRD